MKFSIILPTFNRAQMIHNAIESVLNQTYKNWELVIIDDGSTDNTKEIVNNFQKEDKRIKYIFQENKERSAARNNGVNHAQGEWICFLDSDDLYHITHLETFKHLIIKNKKISGLYFSGVSYGEYDNSSQNYLVKTNKLEFVLFNTIGVPRACCNKEILVKYKFDTEINLGEDKELWSRIVNEYPIFYHYNKTFIENEHPSRSIYDANIKNQLFYINKLDKRIPKKIIRKLKSEAFFFISKNCIKKQKNYEAILFLLKSILIQLNHVQNKHKVLLIFSILGLYKKSIVSGYKIKEK